MAQSKVDFAKKCLVLITGASKGIGRAIALDVAKNLQQDSVMILLARSESGLSDTKRELLDIDKTINVHTHATDLSTTDSQQFDRIIAESLKDESLEGVHNALIFHNAGSTGLMKQTTDLSDFQQWRDYFDLNLFSAAALNSTFVNKFKGKVPRLYVVNITSMCGRTPFKNLAMYGSGKAARELFFKVLALEEPGISVLNYSPGPVDTDMFDGIIEGAQSEEVRGSFAKVKEGSILTAGATVGKLVSILESGNYTSGDTIDYYDRI